MPHDTPLITTIVAALVLAFLFGAIANRLKMPPLVGYLIAGVCVGPHSPGFIADQTLAPQLAEIGVILLMFGVGLHFSLKDLLSVRAVAVPGALIRLAISTAIGIGLGQLMGWPLMGGVVFGLALGVSSTVVTLKALQDRHLVDSDRGHVAMGWLIVEDLAMVLALVLIPAFAGSMGAGKSAVGQGLAEVTQNDAFVALAEQLLHRHLDLWAVIGLTLVKLLAFVGFMVVVGRRIIPAILHATAHTGSRELFRLAVLAIALGVAAGAAYLFGVSLALGAFFAGMILSESELSQRAAQETLPLRDAFGVLFFVSVGMLFDPSIIVTDPLPVLATLAVILFGKTIVGFVLLLIFRRPVAAALQVSAALAQIGEFSFILAALGVGLGVLPEKGQGLILAGAIVSIVLNPLAFWLAERLRPRLEAKPARRAEPELGPVVPEHPEQAVPAESAAADDVLEELAQPTRLSNHVVLIGYGRVGSVVASELLADGTPFVLIEDAEGRVLAAREAGIEVIVGNAATRNTLTLANVMGARCVVIAIPNAFEAGQAVEQCRKLNAAVRIIARAHADEEVDYLTRLGADEVIMGEREIGLGMAGWLKGQEKSSKTTPRLSSGENLLRQARERHSEPTLAEAAGPAEVAGGAGEAASVPPTVVALPTARLAPIFSRVAAPGPEAAARPEPAASVAPEPAGPVAPSEPVVPAPSTAAAEDPVDAAASLAMLSGAPRASRLSPPAGTEAPIVLPPPAIAAPAALIADPVAVEASAVVPPVAEATLDVAPGAGETTRPGVRVVPASEIDILPPEPAASEGFGEGGAAPVFRSAFWGEPEDLGGEVSSGGTLGGELRDVQQEAAARAAMEDGSWLAALERDLFGAGTPQPEVPQPVPQPIETPQPTEDPVPPAQPIETPRPQEDPVPPAQPIETPQPPEVPPVNPPGPPPTRADGELLVEDEVDSLGRREPKLY